MKDEQIDPLLDTGTQGDYRGLDPFGVWTPAEDVQNKINRLDAEVEKLKALRDAIKPDETSHILGMFFGYVFLAGLFILVLRLIYQLIKY